MTVKWNYKSLYDGGFYIYFFFLGSTCKFHLPGHSMYTPLYVAIKYKSAYPFNQQCTLLYLHIFIWYLLYRKINRDQLFANRISVYMNDLGLYGRGGQQWKNSLGQKQWKSFIVCTYVHIYIQCNFLIVEHSTISESIDFKKKKMFSNS